MKKLRIGITIGLFHEAETLWNNGTKQNAVFLAEALKNCPNVKSVVLVNTNMLRSRTTAVGSGTLADSDI